MDKLEELEEQIETMAEKLMGKIEKDKKYWEKKKLQLVKMIDCLIN